MVVLLILIVVVMKKQLDRIDKNAEMLMGKKEILSSAKERLRTAVKVSIFGITHAHTIHTHAHTIHTYFLGNRKGGAAGAAPSSFRVFHRCFTIELAVCMDM